RRPRRVVCRVSLRQCGLGFIFFQAEDGIRARNVTGVQTCALPIFIVTGSAPESAGASTSAGTPVPARTVGSDTKLVGVLSDSAAVAVPVISPEARSIEADVPGSTIPRSAAC